MARNTVTATGSGWLGLLFSGLACAKHASSATDASRAHQESRIRGPPFKAEDAGRSASLSHGIWRRQPGCGASASGPRGLPALPSGALGTFAANEPRALSSPWSARSLSGRVEELPTGT